MSNVLITTLHFYNNFGSVLQAYALKHTLESNYSVHADIFPFRPNIREWEYFTDAGLKKSYADKVQKFDDFRCNVLEMSRQSEPSVEASFLAMNRVANDYDAYIVGSDIVWGREFSNLEAPYFLMHVPGSAKRIAYAASVLLDKDGHTEEDAVFRDGLKHFDAIGMRETSSIEPIQRLASGKWVEAVLDPTLLLDMGDYESLVVENDDMMKAPYLLSYFLTHDLAVVDYTNVIAKKMGLRVIHYFADYPKRIFDPEAGCFAFAGPGEFLGYIKNASMIFTNSFHGTCFSMIYRKPFYTYMAKRNMLSRVRDTVERLGMEERYFTDFRDLSKVTADIDYRMFEQRLVAEQNRSFDFLRRALEV